MKWIKEKLIYIAIIFVNFNFILRLLEKGMLIKKFDYIFTSILFLIGILIYWFYNYVLKKGIFRFAFTMVAFSSIGIFYYENSEFINNLFDKYIIQNGITLNNLIYDGEITYFYQYKIIISMIIPIITALILWITFRFMKKFILMISLAAMISLWFSSSYGVVKEHLFAYIFISSMTFIIMSYIIKIRKYKEQGVKVSLNPGYILMYGVIISLMISKLTTMLPQEYKAKDFSSFGNYFTNEFATGGTPSGKSQYGLTNSGYNSNDKKLGGPVSINYQEVFRVESDKPYYLKGNVKNFYDGSKWTNLSEKYNETQSGTYMGEPSYGSVINSPNRTNNSMTIYPHEKFNTNTVFVPNYVFSILDVEGKLFYDDAPTVLSEKVVKKEYSVQFYKYGDNIDTIEDVSNYKKKIAERPTNIELSFVVRPNSYMDYFLQPKSSIINETTKEKLQLLERFEYSRTEDAQMAKDYIKYLQVPDNITNRTRDLVMDITKESKTSIEKVLAIKKYLTTNYVYELQVPVVPDGIEFIDYFLFQDKKGYCTYFNTAMTVMCRIAGVPARYVEGFKTPSEREERGGLFSVSNADAHAWCEVLLDANMWTIVDASPTASEEVKRKLEELRKAQTSVDKNGEVNTGKIPKPKNEKDILEQAQGDTGSKETLLSDSDVNKIKILVTIILYALIRIIQVLKRRNKLFKTEGVTALYNYYLCRLATMRMVKEDYQGDLEFVKAIEDPILKQRMEILVKGSYEEFYGKHSVETLNNKEYYNFLENYLKEYQGKVGYLLNKYLGY